MIAPGNTDTSSRRYRKMRLDFRAHEQARDAPCWICDMPIRWDVPRLDPRTNTVYDDAWELDHYWPRSTHPELVEDITNARSSHGSCNRNRGNRAPSRPINNPSRRWLK